jgi:hypothetical protein
MNRVLAAFVGTMLLVPSVSRLVDAQPGGNQIRPRDGTGKGHGKGKRGKRAGPRDVSVPIHPPGTGRQKT